MIIITRKGKTGKLLWTYPPLTHSVNLSLSLPLSIHRRERTYMRLAVQLIAGKLFKFSYSFNIGWVQSN